MGYIDSLVGSGTWSRVITLIVLACLVRFPPNVSRLYSHCHSTLLLFGHTTFFSTLSLSFQDLFSGARREFHIYAQFGVGVFLIRSRNYTNTTATLLGSRPMSSLSRTQLPGTIFTQIGMGLITKHSERVSSGTVTRRVDLRRCSLR
jgi:hypothetical protein